MVYDMIIIGAGPAGLSAALTASYMKLQHIVIDAGHAGGALVQSYPWKKVDSFLGYKDKTGHELASIIVKHVEDEGSSIKENEPVFEIKKNGKIFNVITERGEYETKTLLIATGIAGRPRKLGIPGEDSRCVHYSIKNPSLFEGQKVLVVGGGDSAVEGALALAENGADTHIIHRKDVFRCTEKNTDEIKKSTVNIHFNTELKEISVNGRGDLNNAVLLDNINGKTRSEKFDEIFIFIGSVMDMDFLKGLGLKIENNKIVVDDKMQTSVEGVYAAGDITGRLLRIPEAIGEGHMAVYTAFKYLRNPYWA